jgi:hypothetical protein
MNVFNRKNLGLGLMVIGGICVMAPKSVAEDNQLRFTVHVNNYADVDSKMLAEAENVAADIFRKSGVESRWVTAIGPSG